MTKGTMVVAGIIILLVGIWVGSQESHPGRTLYLMRSTTETKRAVFEYEGDCNLIAANMQKAEPEVRWYCR